MKKIAVLWAMFCVISPKIFTCEDLGEVGKYYFPWQLYNYYSGSGNKSGNILLEYPFENSAIFKDILNEDNRYLADSNPSFFDYVRSFFEFIEFIDKISGGPYKRQREEQIERDRYNILNPTEPPKK